MNTRDIQPYEPLKAALDEAVVEFHAALAKLNDCINHPDGPMLLLFAINDVFAAHAVVEARIEAFTGEYGYMRELNDTLTAQRDEANRKLESTRRVLKQLTLDDEASTKGKNRKK